MADPPDVCAPVPQARLQLVAGQPAPAQLSSISCGPTALTTARMLRDPALAHWARTGDPGGRAFPSGAHTETEAGRLAAYHALVHRRTNAAIGPTGRLQAPWPRALGTPPWGVARELEALTGSAPGRYRTVIVRWARADRIIRVVRALAGHASTERPAVLYVGNDVAPRHITLLVPDPAGPGMLLYDPAGGQVGPLDAAALARRRLLVGGWRAPWLLVGPVG